MELQAGWIFAGMFIRFIWNFAWLTNWHPFMIHIVAIGLDSVDASIIRGLGNADSELYQQLDKVSDMLYYIATLVWLLIYYKKIWYSYFFVIFLSFRIIGNVIFIATNFRPILAIFPDFFSLFFGIVTFYDLAGRDTFLQNNFVLSISFIFNFGIQIWREFEHHAGLDFIGTGNISIIFIAPFLFILGILKRKKELTPVWKKFSWDDWRYFGRAIFY